MLVLLRPQVKIKAILRSSRPLEDCLDRSSSKGRARESCKSDEKEGEKERMGMIHVWNQKEEEFG